MGLELSNFVRLLKLRPGVDDDHLLVQQVANDLWFRHMDYAENAHGRTVRKNMTSAEEDLMALALRTKTGCTYHRDCVPRGGCVRASTGGDQSDTRVSEKLV